MLQLGQPYFGNVHGGIRHLEMMDHMGGHNHHVHGGIRHLEIFHG